MKEVIVWSKNNCPACSTAKSLLESKGYTFEERNVDGPAWSKEQLLEAVPTARSVPQIVVDGTVLNGVSELRKYLD